MTAYFGEIREAKRLLDNSFRVSIELKDKHFLAQIALYWAEISLSEGCVEEAEEQLQKILNYQSIMLKTIDQVQLFFVAACLPPRNNNTNAPHRRTVRSTM